MKKKQLYMIGNSHIDPVWFWNWEEGMQEVKATYRSALDRMKEFPDFKFTSTSTAFFEWIEKILPDMFEEIKQRIEEGRWEITGGWFIEPDCILPCGEAFVRQGLYSQRYLKSRFHTTCRIGSNVDSFGHNSMLPQILQKSGMDAYIFMRPRLDTPVFKWESRDGSSVNAISLPGEYTTWFHEPTMENIRVTLERTPGHEKMVCCYGVGNHGGGPTIENINSILTLQDEMEEADLKFSTYTEFLEDMKGEELPVLKGAFEKVNQGCYSIDSYFKYMNRLAEKRLKEADILMTMAHEHTGEWMEEASEMEGLWKGVLFNQFHDTLGGTIIKEAREEGIMQLSGVCARAGRIKALAVQKIVNSVDTAGEGFPLFLFQLDGNPFEEEVEVELNWFCKSPLKLTGPAGQEVPYQRIHTEAKTRNYNIGGRRRIVFKAQIPALGYAVYRVAPQDSQVCFNHLMEIDKEDQYVLENKYLKVCFDQISGQLTSLFDKETNYEALKSQARFRLYRDERDSWGGLQERPFEDRNVEFLLESIEKVESGRVREVIRVRTFFEGTKVEQLFTLGAESHELIVDTRLNFAHPWSMLKYSLPVGKEAVYTTAETAYGTIQRKMEESQKSAEADIGCKVERNALSTFENKSAEADIGCKDEYFMQRFLDVTDPKGRGLAIANNGKYAFHMEDGSVRITVARSAIYAQGNSKNWYNHKESYRYHDIGEQEFRLVFAPHGERLENSRLYCLAGRAAKTVEYLEDSCHQGARKTEKFSLAECDNPGVRIEVLKKAQDDNDTVIRVLETHGKDTCCSILYGGRSYEIQTGPYSIETFKVDGRGGRLLRVNLIEW